MILNRDIYREECRKRWVGRFLHNALYNWNDFQEMHQAILEAMQAFRRDPFQMDITDKFHNPDGTLTTYLRKMQDTLQPDQSRLYPFLDFEEHFQKVFLRRGLIIYCTMILRELEKPEQSNSSQITLNL